MNDEILRQVKLVLERKFGGNQSRMAEALNVAPQSVQQWVSGGGVRKNNWLRIAEMAAEIEQLSETPNSDRFICIPRLDVAASAGHGQSMPEDDTIIEMIRVSAAWLAQHVSQPHGRLALINARGDSMEPTFGDGDLLLVDTGAIFDRDAIFVFTIGTEIYVKRLQRMPDGTVLAISDNSKYRDFALTQDTPHLQIRGRVLFHWRGSKL